MRENVRVHARRGAGITRRAQVARIDGDQPTRDSGSCASGVNATAETDRPDRVRSPVERWAGGDAETSPQTGSCEPALR